MDSQDANVMRGLVDEGALSQEDQELVRAAVEAADRTKDTQAAVRYCTRNYCIVVRPVVAQPSEVR